MEKFKWTFWPTQYIPTERPSITPHCQACKDLYSLTPTSHSTSISYPFIQTLHSLTTSSHSHFRNTQLQAIRPLLLLTCWPGMLSLSDKSVSFSNLNSKVISFVLPFPALLVRITALLLVPTAHGGTCITAFVLTCNDWSSGHRYKLWASPNQKHNLFFTFIPLVFFMWSVLYQLLLNG